MGVEYGRVFFNYFTAMGEAYGGFVFSVERFFIFYMLLYHTCSLFPCTIGSWDAFVSIFQFDRTIYYPNIRKNVLLCTLFQSLSGQPDSISESGA